MPNCKKFTQLISRDQEKPLTLLERCQVEFHLLLCPPCRAFKKNNEKLDMLLNQFCQQKSEIEREQ